MSVEEIRKVVGTDKIVIGTEKTVAGLKRGEVKKVFLTTNCPKEVVADIEHYAKLSGADVQSAGMENDELGIICKRQHSVSVLGVKA